MLRNYIVLLVLLVNLPLVAMAKKPEKINRPAWVDDPKAEYPASLYLSAVGSGDSRANAESNAAGNLAKIFRSDISAQTSYQERYTELMTTKSAQAATQTDSQKKVTVTAKQNLFNIEIGKSWTDPLGLVYVVAYIHRLKTADIYEERILQNSAQIKSYLQEALLTSNSYKAFAFVNAAALINQSNEELLQQLEIISLDTKQSLDLGYKPDELKLAVANQAKAMSFRISVKGDMEDKVRTVISEVLTSQGYTVADEAANLVDAAISFEDVDLQQSTKFVRYNLLLNVLAPDGVTLLSIADSGREGHLNKDEAKARALRTLIAKIRKELPRKLNQYFDGLVLSSRK